MSKFNNYYKNVVNEAYARPSKRVSTSAALDSFERTLRSTMKVLIKAEKAAGNTEWENAVDGADQTLQEIFHNVMSEFTDIRADIRNDWHN